MMIIRQENSEDFNKIYNLVKLSFETAEHSDKKEYELVSLLRNSSSFVSQLSLVAEIDHEIVGHIMFTTAEVEKDIVLVLAPLSVLPNFQKCGVGSALIN